MPKITIKHEGKETKVEANADERLLLAIQRAGVDISHRCGGNAKCTTCQVFFHQGEPDDMTNAEKIRLKDKDLFGTVRLSCQILCTHDMMVEPLKLVHNESWDDAGKTPEKVITPTPEWEKLST